MVVGTRLSRFKSEVLFELGAATPEFGELFRLVKAWAKPKGINNPEAGTFNSFSLSLLVIFHLQKARLLPPLCELLGGFKCDTEDSIQRSDIDLDYILAGVRSKCKAWRERHSDLDICPPFDLLFTFFWRLEKMLTANTGTNFTVSVWSGSLLRRKFAKSSLFQIEDPFCHDENTARTIKDESVPRKTLYHVQRSLLISAGCYASNSAESCFLKGVLDMECKKGALIEDGDSPWYGSRWLNFFSEIMHRSQNVRAPPAWRSVHGPPGDRYGLHAKFASLQVDYYFMFGGHPRPYLGCSVPALS